LTKAACIAGRTRWTRAIDNVAYEIALTAIAVCRLAPSSTSDGAFQPKLVQHAVVQNGYAYFAGASIDRTSFAIGPPFPGLRP